jgi:DNA repair protein RadC
MPRKPCGIRTWKDVYESFKRIAKYRKERAYAVLLDAEDGLLGFEKIGDGFSEGVNACPDQVFPPALGREGRKSLILVHNHPSGFPCPSDQDRKVTRRLYSDGRRLGIDVKDSVIIAAGGYYSFREDGLMGELEGKECAGRQDYQL